MEAAGIPCKQRKLILRCVSKLRYRPTAICVSLLIIIRMGVEPCYVPPSIKLREKAKAKRKAASAAKKR